MAMEEERRSIPTWTRVWSYPWLVRGLPGGITFWRPIEGQAMVVGGALFFATIILRGQGIVVAQGLVQLVMVHLGLPFVIGWAVTKVKLNGKRIDRWLVDRLEYYSAPKRHDRFRAVPAPTMVRYTLDQGGKRRK